MTQSEIKQQKKKTFLFSILFFKMNCVSDAIFTLILDQLPQRCISLFEEGAVVCVSVKLQTTSGHIW